MKHSLFFLLASSRSNRDRKQRGREKNYISCRVEAHFLVGPPVCHNLHIYKEDAEIPRKMKDLIILSPTHTQRSTLTKFPPDETAESITFFDIETQTHTHRAS